MSETNSGENKKLFFSGVVALTIANILVKIIGVFFKIPLQHMIGDEGMGYFNSAYTIYTLFFMISTAGLPVAVSILVSESRARGNLARVRRIFRVVIITFLSIGAIGMLLMFFGSRGFASLIKNESSYYCIMAIAPTIFFICASSAMRGYFQGFQRMYPTSVSEVIEAVGKVAIGILAARFAISRGYSLPVVAAYAICGVTVGVALGMIYMILSKIICERTGKLSLLAPENAEAGVEPSRELLLKLVKIALPITLTASVSSLTNMLDLGIMMRRLQSAGLMNAEQANAFYGNYTTLAVPMFNLPPVLIYPISYSIVPLLSSLFATENRNRAKQVIESALRFSAMLAIPCALGLSAMSGPILRLLYSDESSAIAAPMLSILAIAVFFVGMLAVTNAVLQASGKAHLPVISMVVGGIVKLVSSYILIGAIGTAGTPISTVLCYVTAVVINMIFIIKNTGIMPSVVKTYVRPLFASAAGVAAACLVYRISADRIIGDDLATLVSICVAAVIYVIAVFVLRCVTEADILILPKGERLARILRRARLIR